MRQRSWFVVVALLLVLACKKREDAGVVLQIDSTVSEEISERVARSFTRPSVSAALDAWLESIASDPRVQQRGGDLVQRLMSDSPLAAAFETIMSRVIEAPEVMAALQKLVAQHPDATQDEIGELFGKQFEERWNTPEVNEAWMAAYNAFVAKLEGSAELSAVYRKVIDKLVGGFDADLARTRKWSARVVELEGGKRPDRKRAGEVYLEHAWTDARLDAAAVKILTNPTVRSASAKLAAEILAIDPIVAELRRAASELASHPDVQTQIVRALQVLYADQLSLADVRASLRDLVTHPAVVKPVREVLKVLVTNPRVAQLAADWYASVGSDAALARDLASFWDGW